MGPRARSHRTKSEANASWGREGVRERGTVRAGAAPGTWRATATSPGAGHTGLRHPYPPMMGTKAEGRGLSEVSSLGYRSYRGARTPASGEACGRAGWRPVRRRGSLPRPRGHLRHLLQLRVPGWDSKGSTPFHLAPSQLLANAATPSTSPSRLRTSVRLPELSCFCSLPPLS